MNSIISKRMQNTPPSFIRSILKAADSPEVISFAGGLPNPISFPQEALLDSMNRVVQTHGSKVFQYATTAGYEPLRQWICQRLNKEQHLELEVDDVLITTGSQQALDLLGKVLTDPGDGIILEEPGYLGAIQAFSQYEPVFLPVPLEDDGINLPVLESHLSTSQAKFAYVVPNFQNPTGITYSPSKRAGIRALLKDSSVFLVEDDPYGALCFEAKDPGYIHHPNPMQSVLLGTFSKIVTPGLRIGYLVTKNRDLMKYLSVAKEASDLHSNIFTQYVMHDYLTHNELSAHIETIKSLYKAQSDAMLAAAREFFPEGVQITRPKGGMFLWVTLPDGMDSMELFAKAKAAQVLFVPGVPFYTHQNPAKTLRLNYTNASTEMIREGMRRLGDVMKTASS